MPWTLILSLFSNIADGKSKGFINAIPEDYDPKQGGRTYRSELSQTRKLQTQATAAREKVDRLTREIIEMELKMNISTRWDPTMEEYRDTLKYMAERAYHKALDHLQRLVVQRLFELHRLNVAGVGMSHSPLSRASHMPTLLYQDIAPGLFLQKQ